ncbi:MAG: hypothetical protein QM669_13450 [Siphonobacter sp.]
MSIITQKNYLLWMLIGWVTSLITVSAEPLQKTFDHVGLSEVTHFTPQEYKAQRQNWSISQSPQTRFMYVGNSKGLLEYDGQQWQQYSLPHRQIIRAIAVVGERIYTGALQEFGYWKANKAGKLRYHSLSALNKDPRFKQEEIWNILPIRDAVYFHSFAFLYRYQNNTITTIPTPGNVFFAYEVNDRLFVHILEKGIYEWVGERFVLLKGSEFLGRQHVHCILPYVNNQLLVGVEQGLYRYDGITFHSLKNEASQFLSSYHLNKAIRIDEHTYAFGSILNGLIITDEHGSIRMHLNQKKGLQNNTILSMKRDVDGNAWIGTDSGIDAVLLSSPVRHYQDIDGVLGTVYDATLYQGKLYIGTNHGLFRTDVTAPSFQLVPGTQGQVWDLKVVDNVLFCGHNDGTFLIEGEKVKKISNRTGGLVLLPLARHPDVLIQGTYTYLCIYRKTPAGWVFSKELKGDFPLTNQLGEASDGTVWLKRKYGGVSAIKLSAAVDSIIAVKNFEEFQDGIIVPVEGQLMLFQGKQYHSLQGLAVGSRQTFATQPVQNIFPIQYAAYLVLEKNNALAYWQPGHPLRELNLKHMQWVEGYENVIRLNEQSMLICGDDGFSILPISYIQQSLPFTKPIIREIRTNQFNRTLYPNQNWPELSFKYWQNNLTIRLSSTQYEANFSCQYLLEGVMNDWSASKEDNYLKLGPLEPGKYVLRIRSSSSKEEIRWAFEIRPPWYWNVWSQALYVLLAFAAGMLLYYGYRYRIHTHQSQIRQKMQEQLEEEQRLNAQVVTELRNEQLRKDIDRKSAELANSAMNLLHKNELLETIKTELDKLRKELGSEGGSLQYRSIVQLIDRNLADEHSWDVFEANFNDVHDYFFKKLLKAVPDLTPGDLKLAAYLRMNLSSKEIAQLLNITVRSVELKRYRLRTKLALQTEQNLSEFLMKI